MPFQIVDNFHLKRFLYILNPNYKLPSKETISNQILDSMYNQACSIIKKDLEEINYIAATTDCWTSKQKLSYIGVTIHYIGYFILLFFYKLKKQFIINFYKDSQWKMVSHTIAVSNIIDHDHLSLKERLVEIFDSWLISDKVKIISIDNAKNISKAVGTMDVTLIRCLGHTINLMVRKVLTDSPSFDINQTDIDHDENTENAEVCSVDYLQSLLKKCRMICSKFNHSSQLNHKLIKEQGENGLHLIQEVLTRWNSTYSMIERLVKLRLYVNNVLTQSHSSQNKNKSLILNDNEEKNLNDLIDTLYPFFEITKKLSGEYYSTVSCIVPSVKSLHLSMEANLKSTESTRFKFNVASNLKKSIEHYLSNYCILENDFLIATTFLDPRYFINFLFFLDFFLFNL